MASKAAKKHATPPEIIEESEEESFDVNNKSNYVYFCQKVLPNALPLPDLRRKILEKSTVEESQLQLNILDDIEELNIMLFNKKPIDLFHNQSCVSLYRRIVELQMSQRFAASGWKVVGYAVLVPMLGTISIFASGVFHTKKCELFSSWVQGQKTHLDLNLSPMTDLFRDSSVDQQIGLVEKPTQYTKSESDWSITDNLESFNASSDTVDSKTSSIDSGKTVAGPSVPMMDAHDISQVGSFDDTTQQDSYLDISFISVKKRANLSKREKISILEGSPISSVHSTPVRNGLHPRFSTSLKREFVQTRPNTPQVPRPSYITKFLNKWFRSQMANMPEELKAELSKME